MISISSIKQNQNLRVFYNNNKEKYFFIKPKKNCVILFDALQSHSTIPIISGVKYSYTNFYTLKD